METPRRDRFLLLYAKRSFRASPRELAGRLRSRTAEHSLPDLEEARAWLIALGQIEQAVLDAGLTSGEQAIAATMAAANVFLAARSGSDRSDSIRNAAARLRFELQRLLYFLEEQELDFRIPEGFAWYALYPDSYAQTAEDWSHRFDRAGADVCVVGLRSIGTTLAAVVAQALRGRGFDVRGCTTVRPSGIAPFRRAELPPGIEPASQNIVVDEGPGLSGSSMVAVAQALIDAGADADAIHFFAGHGYGPGQPAGAHLKEWWNGSRVWTTSPEATLIGRQLLPDALASAAEDCAGEPADGPAEPLGTTGWQQLAGLRLLPRAVAPSIEAPKKLVRLRSGRHVILKFAGLGLTGRRDYRHGWLIAPWVDGRRLTAADANIQFVEDHLGPWIAAASSERLQPGELQGGISRTAKALSAWAEMHDDRRSAAAIKTMAECELARIGSAPQPCYGDGRLAPHEWIREPNGLIRKVDAGGHDCDHTWVGRQPIVWDLVGAEVEWGLSRRSTEALHAVVQQLTGYSCSEETRAFYAAGYCAFRAAAAHYSAMSANDVGMPKHLHCAFIHYERRLKAALASITIDRLVA